MTFPDHIRATLRLGLPLVGAQVAQTLVGVTDTIMIGWYGVEELAAVALGATYFHAVLILGMGFGLAVAPLVASAHTGGDARAVRRSTRMGLWLGTIFGIVSLPFFLFSERILLELGQAPSIAEDAAQYLWIAGLAMTPGVLVIVLRSHLSALDRPNIVPLAWLVGLGLNAVLNWVLIFGRFGLPELGIEGAAWASVGTNVAILLVLLAYALRAEGLRQYELLARFFRPDWEAFFEVFRLAWPISLTLMAEAGLFFAATLMMGWIGTLELAAHGIALQITSVTFMVHVGLSSAATVRVGQCIGQNDLTGVRHAGNAAFLVSGLMVAATMVLFVVAGAPLTALFVDKAHLESTEIIALGASLLIVSAVFQFGDAAQVMALGVLRGLKDTTVPMIGAFFCYWVIGVPAAYVLAFPLGFAGEGVWAGLAIGLIFAGVFLIWRFVDFLRNKEILTYGNP